MIIVLSPCVSLVGIDAKDNNIIFLLRRVWRHKLALFVESIKFIEMSVYVVLLTFVAAGQQS
jgi:hypothetical protein